MTKLPKDKFIHKLLIKFIPHCYKQKYQDHVCNRKHSSGYWFDFIIPREIAHYTPTKDINSHLIRWFNFYFTKRVNLHKCRHPKKYLTHTNIKQNETHNYTEYLSYDLCSRCGQLVNQKPTVLFKFDIQNEKEE